MLRTSLLLAVLALSACTGRLTPNTAPVDPGPPVDIDAPASGALTLAQLDVIAADIRTLEANPLGQGARAARAALITWLTGSPDVSATVCQGVAGPFTDSDSFYASELFGTFILGLAAHLIENPDDDGDAAAINLGAMESALTAYSALRERDPDPRSQDAHMDRMLVRQRTGTLDEFIENAALDC